MPEPAGSIFENLPYLARLTLDLSEEVKKLREVVHSLEIRAAEMGVSAIKDEIAKISGRLTALENFKERMSGSIRTWNIVWGALWSVVVVLLAWKLSH